MQLWQTAYTRPSPCTVVPQGTDAGQPVAAGVVTGRTWYNRWPGSWAQVHVVVQLSSNPRGREASRINRRSTRRETRGARLPNGRTCEKGVAHSPVTRSRPEVLDRERPVTG